MEIYDSEQEQIDAIKQWWKKNGNTVLTVLIVGLLSFSGWQYWTVSTANQRAQASVAYDNMMAALDGGDAEKVKESGGSILTQFGDTAYGALAAMALAKIYVEEGDLASAGTYLQTVVSKKDYPELQQVARIRLARVQLAEGNAEAALATLNTAKANGFEFVHHELKGDIYAAMGERDLARSSYESALDVAEQGVDVSVLKMKLDELGGQKGDDA